MVDPFLLISVKSDHMDGVMDQWKRSIGYNTGIRMTNVKIQMTNQIQMFKCLNDSVKNPGRQSGLLLPSAGTASSFLRKAAPHPENCFLKESQSRLNWGTLRSKPEGH